LTTDRNNAVEHFEPQDDRQKVCLDKSAAVPESLEAERPAAQRGLGALERRTSDPYDPASPGRKVLVGALDTKLIGIDDNRHMLTVAGSRAGKSVMLVANLVFYRGSVLALDPKGELANLTARRRDTLGQDIHVLDPFLTCADHVAPYRKRYNPLAILRPDSDTIIEDAGMIADALVVPSGGKDPHWDESARNFIEGLIMMQAVVDAAAHGDLEASRYICRFLNGHSTKPSAADGVYVIVIEGLIRGAMLPGRNGAVSELAACRRGVTKAVSGSTISSALKSRSNCAERLRLES
jgi:Type IV secretory system Conjugative DNA transfer